MMNSNKFEIEVIASGSFLDADPGFCGKTYRIETRTIRLNPIALEEYFSGNICYGIEDFESREEYEEYIVSKKLIRDGFVGKVSEILGFDRDKANVNISRIVSEVFGVAYITEEK